MIWENPQLWSTTFHQKEIQMPWENETGLQNMLWHTVMKELWLQLRTGNIFTQQLTPQ